MDGRKPRIAVFVSGGGSNLQALIEAARSGALSGEIALVVSSRRDAFGLQRASKAGIATMVFKDKKFDSLEEAGRHLLAKHREMSIDFIALAGYMRLLPANFVQTYRNRIVNIHPALLPGYGGKGMYGHHVHEAVIAAGDTESGVTVHLVDEIYDHGRILEQWRVPVMKDDTPQTLAARVLKAEHEFYSVALEKLITGKYE